MEHVGLRFGRSFVGQYSDHMLHSQRFSAFNKNYEDALKFISKVVSFFQVNNVFQNDPAKKPSNDEAAATILCEVAKLTENRSRPHFKHRH